MTVIINKYITSIDTLYYRIDMITHIHGDNFNKNDKFIDNSIIIISDERDLDH